MNVKLQDMIFFGNIIKNINIKMLSRDTGGREGVQETESWCGNWRAAVVTSTTREETLVHETF